MMCTDWHVGLLRLVLVSVTMPWDHLGLTEALSMLTFVKFY